MVRSPLWELKKQQPRSRIQYVSKSKWISMILSVINLLDVQKAQNLLYEKKRSSKSFFSGFKSPACESGLIARPRRESLLYTAFTDTKTLQRFNSVQLCRTMNGQDERGQLYNGHLRALERWTWNGPTTTFWVFQLHYWAILRFTEQLMFSKIAAAKHADWLVTSVRWTDPSVPAGVCKEDKNYVKAIGKHLFLFPQCNRACQSHFYGRHWGSE